MSNAAETEDQLIQRAQQALSRCNWEIGECASRWTVKFSRGRTDVDFGSLIGLSGDQVYQRRRVWESFADVHENYPRLKWSHFYVSLNWDDSAECLQWANDMEATVAEMKAWRRAQLGENLSEPDSESPPFEATGEFLSFGTGMVRDPGEFRREGERTSSDEFSGDEREPVLAVASANREVNSDYAPFGKGARGPAPGERDEARSDADTEQTFKRTVATLERVVSALTPEVLEDYGEFPIALQQRFHTALENLQARTAGLF